MLVETAGLTKVFGEVRAVDDLTVKIPDGAIGLVGPNGAGKTTFLRLLLSLVRPTAGTAKVRRLRRDPRVTIASSGVRGGVKGPAMNGHARMLDGSEEDLGRRAIRARYGWQAALVAFVVVRLQRRRQLYYEVRAGGAEAAA